MADKNEGILVVGAVRPQYTTDVYSVAYANEIRGGFHSVTSSTDRDSIFPDRREWGMICYVIDEDATYQLKLNYYDSDLSQNANWVLYTPDADNSHWSDAVIDIIGTVPGTVSNGDRYIIATPSYGVFLNKSNQFAEYKTALSSWVFTQPMEQSTTRLTNQPNVLAVFYGTHSTTGRWVKEYQNPVRYVNFSSTNGLTYSFSSVTQSQLFTYSNVAYYSTFATSNSGTVSVSIDGLEYVRVKKITSNTLQDLTANDVRPGLEYQMVYNYPDFQITLPYEGTTTIGVAESGGYTQGLFEDFTNSTPLGTVIDRFNQIFKYIVPESAPSLSSWTISSTSQFLTGKVSISATASSWGPTAIGGLFTKNSGGGYILGITSQKQQTITGTQYYQDITGILNSQVSTHPSLPKAAYSQYSFGNGLTGSLYLYVNSFTVSNVSLTGFGSIDTTSSGATSGFVISAATTSKFPLGVEYLQTYYTEPWNRTGTFRIKPDSSFIVDGLNYINVTHNFGTTAINLNRFEFYSDSSSSVTSYSTPQGTNYNSTSKFISGIRYINNLSFNYAVQTSNIYSNSYYHLSDAGVFGDPFGHIIPNPSSQSLTVPTSVSSTFTFSTTYTTRQSIRRINESIVANITTKRTVQGTTTGATLSVTGWVIDTFATSSTLLVENFDDERYRLINGGYASYSLTSGLSSSTWNSQNSLYLTSGYRNALQVVDGGLTYPRTNYSSIGTSITNPNYSLTQSNYALCFGSTTDSIFGTQTRSYTRYFKVSSQRSSIRVNLSVQSTNFVTIGTNINTSTNLAYLEFKLPYKGTEVPVGGTVSDGGVTGWLDASKPFVPGAYENGDGCYDQTNSTGTYSIAVTFGQKNTYYSDNNILMRITTGPFFTGSILSVTIS